MSTSMTLSRFTRIGGIILLAIAWLGYGPDASAQDIEPLPAPESYRAIPEAPPPEKTRQLPPASRERLPEPIITIRIKDITSIEGHRVNRVQGYGLVTGLKQTGGKSQLTQDLTSNMLRNMGVQTRKMPTGSVAVVLVNAEIPPTYRPGEELKNVTVSVVDDSTGLYGGVLQPTMLLGMDGKTYAVASGPLRVSGFSAGGAAGSITKNHDTTGQVTALIEAAIPTGPAYQGNAFRLLLKNKDYTTASRIATEINRHFPGHARPVDQGTIEVFFPHRYRNQKHDFVVAIHNLRITPDSVARVVINQKTGTIVFGQNVHLSKIMFAHGNLIISTNETPVASQPLPFSDGRTQVLDRTQINVVETGGRYNVLNQNITVGDLAASLNMLGVSPQDLISIFQAIDSSGALQAKLIIE